MININLKYTALILISLILYGCSTAPMLNVAASPIRDEQIRTVALAPNSGVLGDAIGFELIKYGFEVFDTAQVSSMMVRMNLNEIEILEPQNLKKLKTKGIDSMLQVRVVAGYDGRPQSASVKMVSTSTGKIMAGASWQNGRAGAQGSLADQDARVGMSVAAQQIAKGISDAINKKIANK